MQVGDKVVDMMGVGVVVGVSTAGNPIVEWKDGEFAEYEAEELLVVDVQLPEDLNPNNEIA